MRTEAILRQARCAPDKMSMEQRVAVAASRAGIPFLRCMMIGRSYFHAPYCSDHDECARRIRQNEVAE